jgi:hypothetical protein
MHPGPWDKSHNDERWETPAGIAAMTHDAPEISDAEMTRLSYLRGYTDAMDWVERALGNMLTTVREKRAIEVMRQEQGEE